MECHTRSCVLPSWMDRVDMRRCETARWYPFQRGNNVKLKVLFIFHLFQMFLDRENLTCKVFYAFPFVWGDWMVTKTILSLS